MIKKHGESSPNIAILPMAKEVCIYTDHESLKHLKGKQNGIKGIPDGLSLLRPFPMSLGTNKVKRMLLIISSREGKLYFHL